MKLGTTKTCVACGLLALSATAMAQESSVTIYGRVDTSLESVKVDGQRISRVHSNGSYIGFTGEEDLGHGLKVGFLMESSFHSDDGTTDPYAFFNNGTEIYLEGSAGTLRMGRYFNPSYYAIASPVSLHNEDAGVSLDLLYAGVENDSNRIGYKTPELAGLTLETSVSFHEKAEEKLGKKAYDLALNYEAGNWSFGAGYGKWAEANQWALRATWSDGPWKISGYHQRSKDWDANYDVYAVAPGDGKRNVSRIALTYAWDASDVHLNFGRANGPRSQSANQWTVGYNYHLSKRTKLYAHYTSLTNKNGASYGIDGMGENSKLRAMILGMRHLF